MKKLIVQLVSGLTGAGLALVGFVPVIAQSATLNASIFFTPATKSATFLTGAANTFTVDLMVNTGGQPVVGVDAVVTFDTTYLEFVSASNTGSPFTVPIVIAQGAGRQLITGLVAPGSTTAVNSVAAKVSTLTFKTLRLGTTTLGIDQAQSNVAHQNPAQGDILGSVVGAAINTPAGTGGGDDGTGDDDGTIPPFIPGTGGTGPFITNIVPNAGHKDAVTQVTIFGGNFGNFQTGKSKVFVGLLEATVLDWNNTQILAQFPANASLTSKATLTVRVLTAGDQQVSFYGYTYTSGALPGSGPEDWLWPGVALMAFALSVLAYRKLEMRSADELVTAEPIDPVEKI